MPTTTIRYDENDLYTWDRIETTTDDVVTLRFVVFDDGRTTQTEYIYGVRSSLMQFDSQDGSGTKSWDSIESYYDEAGLIAARVTTYDNGIVKESTFENGIRAKVVQFDNPDNDSGGVKNWSSVESYYDQSGKIEAKITFFDNGVVKEELFENGERAKITQIDNPQEGGPGVKSWDTIESYYDETGVIEARITNWDNGVLREELFEDGVRVKLSNYDNPEFGGAGVKSWDSIETYYDAQSGEIEAKVTKYDDGRVKEELYENGQKAQVYTQDDAMNGTDGVYAWDEMFQVYDANGNLEADVIIFDNGDAQGAFYDDGALMQVLEYDGDGSEPWLGQRTTYDDAGEVALVENWQNEWELPPEFGFGYALSM